MITRYYKMLRITAQVSLFVPLLAAAASQHRLKYAGWDNALTIHMLAVLAGALLITVALTKIFQKSRHRLQYLAEEQALALSKWPDSHLSLAIVLAAALSLYLELAVIRWLATVFPVFALYKNFSLLACFAGLGLGYAMARQRQIPLALVIPIVLWLMLFIVFLRFGMGADNVRIVSDLTPVTERWAMGLERVTLELTLAPLHILLGVTFMLTALAFLPVGQLCGSLMERRAKLQAYGLNLLGSLLGVGLIFMISYLWLPPTAWFALAFALILIFLIHNPRVLAASALCGLGAVMVLNWPVAPMAHHMFSPYQNIERTANAQGLLMISAAGHYFQNVHDLSVKNANRESDPYIKELAHYYELPYYLHAKPGRVAIVGSGTGNDVAAAVRMGAGLVDAIEIDPVILDLGRTYHPERPYQQTQVRIILNDARTFFRTTKNKYDLLVYGLLDSHTLLSHASSVRLDSFVYTVEGLREAKACLKEGGTLCLSFALLGAEMGRKIYLMLQEAFDGKGPLCLKAGENKYVFVQRKGADPSLPADLLKETGFKDVGARFANPNIPGDPSTDDWPFLYMPKRIYPVSFLPMAGIVLVLSLVLTRMSPGQNLNKRNLVFFLLGAGFMLVETKAITELGLAFGNTWQVIGIAISAILAMAFLANYAVSRFGFDKIGLPFVLLIISLGFGLWISLQGGLPPTAWGRLATAGLLTCPVFFSGIIFSTLLKRGENISGVMGANLLGAMLGGLLEYNSMYFGFSFLYLLAMLLYGTAWICARAPMLAPDKG